MKSNKLIQIAVIGLVFILCAVIVYGIYDMFFRNRSYEQIHPMESVLAKHGLSKICADRSDGSFNPFGGSNGHYKIYYVTELNPDTVDKIFINDLAFSEDYASFNEISSYAKEMNGVQIYGSLRKHEQANPELCFPESSDPSGIEIKVPKNSLLFTIGNGN